MSGAPYWSHGWGMLDSLNQTIKSVTESIDRERDLLTSVGRYLGLQGTFSIMGSSHHRTFRVLLCSEVRFKAP